MAASEDYSAEHSLHPCGYCGRKFNSSSIEKHQNVCQKTFIQKRKIFDSHKQRQVVGEGLPAAPKQQTNRRSDQSAKSATKQSIWREKHENFIKTIQAARTCAVAQKLGKPLPPPPPAQIPSDYICCPSCGRHFGQKAADRHIQWCKEQKNRIPQSPQVAVMGKDRLDARIKYKAPSLKKQAAAPGPNLVSTKGIPASNAAARGQQFPGKPPVRASNQGNYEKDRDVSSGVRVRGTSLSPPKRGDLASVTQSCTEVENPARAQHGGNLRMPPTKGKPYLPGKGMRNLPGNAKLGKNGYNPYSLAEKQMRDLEEDSSYLPHSKESHQHTGKPTSQSSSKSTSNPNLNSKLNGRYATNEPTLHTSVSRVSKPPPVHQAKIQPLDASTWEEEYNYSDSDDDTPKYPELDTGDVRGTSAFSPLNKVNDSAHSASRNKMRHHGSKSSMTSLDSDYSSLSRQRSPSPPLKLPSATVTTTRRRHGGSNSRMTDYEHRLSTSSSDSSLPPLNNRNTYNSSNSSINSNFNGDAESWTARFCHECGSGYPITNAKFCCECGARRLYVT